MGWGYERPFLANESAATAGEDGRAVGEACPDYWLLLAEAHMNRRRFGGVAKVALSWNHLHK